ncbi:MAG: VOC family protein [Actinomycetota bacterium]|nr:VOC family protein [Actinomycetota bacterium]
MHVGSVVIDCNDFSGMLAFWQEALRYVPKYPPKENDWALLIDPRGDHVNVGLQCVPEKRVGKNRLHLDLYAEDPEEEVERLVKLGAKIYRRAQDPDEDFVVLEDPEGNLFCVVDVRESADSDKET